MRKKNIHKHTPWYSRFSKRTCVVTLIVLGGLAYSATIIVLFRPDTQASAPPCHYTSGEWVFYEAADDSFRLQFPCWPRKVTTRVATAGSKGMMLKQEYIAQGADNTSYYLNVLVYAAQADLTKDPAFQDDFLKGMLAGTVNGALVSSYTTSTPSGSALEYEIRDAGNGYFLRGRNFLRGNALYALLATNTTGVFREADYAKFVQSFQLQ